MNFTKVLEMVTTNIKSVLIIGTFILAILYFKSCSNNRSLKAELDYEGQRTEQNIKAYSDSVEMYKDKNGIGFQKAIANMSMKELKEFNPELYKIMKDESGVVKTIIRTEVIYRDTGSVLVVNNLDSLGNNLYALDYKFDNDFISFKGKSNFSATAFLDYDNTPSLRIKEGKTEISDLTMLLTLTTGIKNQDGIDKIFIKSSNPDIIIGSIEGADVSNYIKDKYKLTPPEDKKKFSLNLSIGYGMTFSKGNQIYHGPGIQLGLGYNILSF